MAETASFGYWVRRRRKALDLTQAELARRVGAAAITIQKIEADERRPSRQVAELLAEALAVPPDERPAFIAAARGERAVDRLPLSEAPLAAPASALFNLPTPPTPFIGRVRELADAPRLLETTRLLTLTGPAGSGKTRLSLEIARAAAPRFAVVVFVPLATVTDARQVIPTIANALDVKATAAGAQAAALADHLRERPTLLVLDNFEQVIAAGPAVAALLEQALALQLLITSREALRVAAEQEYPVPPLAAPDPRRRESPASLSRYEAVELFVRRARAARPDFVLTEHNAAAVAELCARLDGLPLAIELAAARIRVFTPQGLLARLERRLELLTGGPRDLPARQQTLREAIRWSYDLLDESERMLFGRLGVFVGGWTLEAAEAICADERLPAVAVLETLASLVAKSLVYTLSAGEMTRFAMLETIREYALERLIEGGEATALRRRHMAHYATWLLAIEPRFFGADQAAWLDHVEREHDNVRAALRWSLSAGEPAAVEEALRLVGAMSWFWHLRGYWSEGREWGEAALRQGAGLPPAARARALRGVGILAWAQDDYPTARRWLEEGLQLVSPTAESRTRAHALGLLGLVHTYEGRLDEAPPLFAESLALFRRLEDDFGVGVSLIRLAIVANLRGDHDRAAVLTEEALALYRRSGNPWGIATSLGNLGEIAMARGDWRSAAPRYHEALATMRATGSHWYLALLLAGIAGVAVARGRAAEGAELLGASDALLSKVRGSLPHLDRLTYERAESAARGQLGEMDYAAACARGRGLSEEAWLALAERVLEGGDI